MLVPFGVFADALDSATAPSTLVAAVLAGAAVVLVVLALFAWLTIARIPNQQVGVVEKLWSRPRLGARGEHHRPRRRGRLPGRPAARRPALRPVALAVPHPQGAAGHHPAGQDRLRLRPRRRAAAAQPDAGPGRPLQQLPGRPRLPGRRPARTGRSRARGQRGRQRAILREGVYAINPALFVVITEDAVYRLRQLLRSRARPKTLAGWQQQQLQRDRRLQPGRGRRARSTAADPLQPEANDQRGQHRHRHRPRRPVAGARRDHRPGGRQRPRTIPTTTTTTRTPRRSSAPAAAAAGSTCR